MTETDKYAPEVSHTVEMANNPPIESPQPTHPAAEPEWMIDDNTPGQGARPDWLPTKYKKVSDAAKAYTELEKKLGAFTGAPEAYDAASLEVDANDPTFQALSDVAKELNMSPEGFNKMIGRLASIQEAQSNMHIEEEVKKLGPDGERMLKEYKNWVNDYVPAAEREVVTEWVKNADDLKVFNRIMSHTHMSNVPTQNSMHIANAFEGVAELKAEMNKNIDRFKSDATYRKDWSSRMERAVKRIG
jgi:predicted transcriptional regulator